MTRRWLFGYLNLPGFENQPPYDKTHTIYSHGSVRHLFTMFIQCTDVYHNLFNEDKKGEKNVQSESIHMFRGSNRCTSLGGVHFHIGYFVLIKKGENVNVRFEVRLISRMLRVFDEEQNISVIYVSCCSYFICR